MPIPDVPRLQLGGQLLDTLVRGDVQRQGLLCPVLLTQRHSLLGAKIHAGMMFLQKLGDQCCGAGAGFEALLRLQFR